MSIFVINFFYCLFSSLFYWFEGVTDWKWLIISEGFSFWEIFFLVSGLNSCKLIDLMDWLWFGILIWSLVDLFSLFISFLRQIYFTLALLSLMVKFLSIFIERFSSKMLRLFWWSLGLILLNFFSIRIFG